MALKQNTVITTGGLIDSLDAEVSIRQALYRGAAIVDNMRPTLNQVALRVYYPMVAEAFETEGHGRWPQLAKSTIKRRGRFVDSPMLQRTGALKDSMTQIGADGNVHLFLDRNTLVLGSSLPQAIAAGPRSNKSIERLVVDPSNKDIQKMAEVAKNDIIGRLHDAKLAAKEVK